MAAPVNASTAAGGEPAGDRLAEFLEQVRLPLQRLSSEGVILAANAAELELLGWPAGEYLGRNVREFHADSAALEEMLGRLARGDSVHRHPCRLRCRDGSLREVLVSAHGRFEAGGLADIRCITHDITEQRRTELALRASEERYRALVEGQAEMLCRFRPDGTILFANAAYAQAFDTTPDTLLGSNFWSYVPEHDQPAVRAMLESLTPEEPQSRVENRIQTTQGERWVLWTNRAIAFDAGRRLLEAQSAGIDITRRKQAEQALQEADRRKDEFLATLAHELRNPLAPISNSLGILRCSRVPAEQQGALDAIERQLSHLVRLVDDLLDMSRITRDKLELRRARIELVPLLRQALEGCRVAAERGGLHLELAADEAPIVLDADPVRLAQVLNNLLNNACKYTPSGGSIRVSARAAGGQAVISVSDTGIGMPADQLEAIFEMFAQVEDAERRSAGGGLGIGLTLVKRLIELHGGEVEAHSDGPGTGSEFVVRLPLAAGPEAIAAPVAAECPAGAAGLRVLVVDDNQDSADSLGLLLALDGCETRVVYDGLAALEEGERFAPAVVLLDLGLPRLGGIEACRRMRAEPWGRDITIVALTGWGQDQDRRRSRDAGFDEHLVKPVGHATLQGLLARLPR